MPFPLPRVLRRLVRAVACVALPSSFIAAAAGVAGLPAPLLVKDFDPGSYVAGSNPRSLAVAGERIFFSGWDAAHGDEPWISDGSAAGTRRIADLCYGPCSSYPAGFVQLGEAVVFHDNDGYEFRIQSFAEGEVREVAVFGNGITQWAPLGSLVFFAPRDTRLWRTDGTSEGTYPVAELHPEPSYQEPPEMAAVNGAIYFADAGSLQRLTEDGEVREIFSLGGSPGARATSFTPLGSGRFLFTGCADSFTPCQAYVSDGTAAGTRSLEPVPGGLLTAGAQKFVIWRGRAYFETQPPGSFYPPILVSTDGTPAGTRLESFFPEGSELFAATTTHLLYTVQGGIHAFDAGLATSALTSDEANTFGILGRLGERLVFTYGDPGGIARPGFSRVAVTDGTPDGTADLADRTGDTSAGSAVAGGFVYFSGGEAGSGRASLWRTDGSAGGTEGVESPRLAPASSWPKPYRVGAALVAEATDELDYESRHAYRIDPSTLESRRIDETPLQVIQAGRSRIFLATSPYSDATTYAYDGEDLATLPIPGRPREGVVAGDDRYFFFTDVDPGQKLWESDGSAAGTRLLFDFPVRQLTCNGYCGYVGAIASSADSVYFWATGESAFRLSVWDRQAGEKRTVRDSNQPPQLMLPMPGGRLVFSEGDFFSESSLWTSDGTAAGTRLFHSIEGPTNLMRVFEMGGRFYFGLDSGEPAGEVLWTSDLTAEGTRPVAPLGDVGFRASAVAGGRFYFSTEKNGAGRELGVTDGTAAGTRFFDLRPGPEGSDPGSFFGLDDGRLVFAAAGDAAGYELWISDGTRLGTYRLTDLNPGEAASAPQQFAQVGNRLFFQADDGQTGRELWGLDLPPAGAAPCPAGSTCLLDGRFEISLVAHAPDGDFPARREVGNETSAVYSFFSPGNWEMLLKVLDGCAINGHRWVYAAAATDVAFTLRIRDRESGEVRVYRNAAGQASPAITDAAAFSCGGAFGPSLSRLSESPISRGAL